MFCELTNLSINNFNYLTEQNVTNIAIFPFIKRKRKEITILIKEQNEFNVNLTSRTEPRSRDHDSSSSRNEFMGNV